MDTIFRYFQKSDIHQLVLSVFKTKFTKSKPKEITYRNYRKVLKNHFNQDLHNQLSSGQLKDYAFLEKIFLLMLEEHAPLKEKLLRSNYVQYVTKTLWKAIMRRSYLVKLYFKKRIPSSLKKHKKQKKYCN